MIVSPTTNSDADRLDVHFSARSSLIAIHFALGVRGYRVQQNIRRIKDLVAFPAIGFIAQLQPYFAPNEGATAVIGVLSTAVLVCDGALFEPMTDRIRERSTGHFNQGENELFGGATSRLITPDEEDEIAKNPGDLSGSNELKWFPGVSKLRVHIRGAAAAGQETLFRTCEHLHSLCWAAILFILTLLIPLAVGCILQGKNWSHIALFHCLPAVNWYLPALFCTRRNARAAWAFYHIRVKTYNLINEHINKRITDAQLQIGGHNLLNEINALRAMHGPVERLIYRMLRSRNNRRAAHLIKQIEAREELQ